MVTGSVQYLYNRKHDETNGGKEEEPAGLLTKRKKNWLYKTVSLPRKRNTEIAFGRDESLM